MTLPSWLVLMPLALQAALMFFDEFYFHHKRGLPLWEILGHPLDTLTVITPLAYAYFYEFNDTHVQSYCALAVISCIFVIKDEWIHKDICSKGEMIVHGFLFVLHPLIFASIFLIWQNDTIILFGIKIFSKTIITGQLTLTIAFIMYQIFYWSIFYDARHKQRHLQRTR